MRVILLAALAALFVSTAHAEPMTPAQAAALLQKSVVALENNGHRFCSAFKIGPRNYMTAGHCIRGVDEETRVVFFNGDRREYSTVGYILKGVSEKKEKPLSRARPNDWGVVHITTENKNVSSLFLDCPYRPSLGDGVAFMGYPANLEQTFSLGYVSSVNPIDNNYSAADFAIDVQAAPGASGSPVITLDGGKVIGVLIEGVYNSRNDFYMIGLQAISNTSPCDPFREAPQIGTERTDIQ